MNARPMSPGTQWKCAEHNQPIEWEVECPGLGYSFHHLNTVMVIQCMEFGKLTNRAGKNGKAEFHIYPHLAGKYFIIPALDSPIFYSLRAAAKWALEYEQ